jgi:hypothetical protein
MITLSWYHDNMLSYFFFLKTSHTAPKRHSPILFICLPEPPLAEMALWRGAPAVYSTLEQFALQEILLLEEIKG